MSKADDDCLEAALPALSLLHFPHVDGGAWSVTVDDWRYGDHSGAMDVGFGTKAEAEAFIARCRAAGVTTLKDLHNIIIN